jgi:prepilin-type N-terminal cleavage/methylation domain-containing protein
MTKARTSGASDQGFTLIEAIIVLALIMIAALIGFPALQNMIHRSKVEGAVTQIAMTARAARLDAIKESVQFYVQADFANDRVVVYRETNTPGTGFDPATDEEVRSVLLPSLLSFWGPADAAPEGGDATYGLPADEHITMRPDGSADVAGGIRFGDAKGNYLEMRIDPPAAARVQIRKWDGMDWRTKGQGGKAWKWN